MLAVLIAGLFMFALGGMLLMLMLGARRIEEELNERARETRQAELTRIPRFFMVKAPAAPPGIGQFDDAFMWRLQHYLEAEQLLADEFVLQPSIENLYRESARTLTRH